MCVVTRTRMAWLTCLVLTSFTIASPPTGNAIQCHPSTVGHAQDSVGSFEKVRELSAELVVEQVLARNPTLARMAAAWEAASARYPQVIALDDPMLSGVIAPASINSPDVEVGYRIELSQKLPFPGKRRLRGQSALAEASAAGNELEDARVQLIEAAQLAFYDYYLIDRARSVNEESLRLLTDFRKLAQDRVTVKQAPQQDVLLADVDIGRQQERGLNLERQRKVAVARLNTLMHLPPTGSLPPPPKQLMVSKDLPDREALESAALGRRPDLQALVERINAEEAALRAALREYYPDIEATAAFDTIMGNGPTRDLAGQVGLRINLPIRRERRSAAVAEAQARISQRQAELTARFDQVRFEVQQAFEQVVESAKVVELYDRTILRRAQENVQAARTAYTAKEVPFLSLLEAQRTLINLRDRYYEATADYFRRWATLERTTGGPLPRTEPRPAPR